MIVENFRYYLESEEIRTAANGGIYLPFGNETMQTPLMLGRRFAYMGGELLYALLFGFLTPTLTSLPRYDQHFRFWRIWLYNEQGCVENPCCKWIPELLPTHAHFLRG